jgi:hypothetical protein
MKILKSKKIKFSLSNENSHIEKPKPSRLYVPEWYKKMPSFTGSGHAEVRQANAPTNLTMKHCVPALDAWLTGYVVELWQDMEIVKGKTDQEYQINWGADPTVLESRNPNVAETFPIPLGHKNIHFAWKNPVSMQVPLGYSLLITHPLNRFDLPFTTVSAIVDADVNPMGEGSIPFFIKEDFEGIIPKGTPLFQVIPFKRESWESELDDKVAVEAYKINRRARSITHGFYKKFSWSRKEFN